MSIERFTRDGYLSAGYLGMDDLGKDEVRLFFYNHGQPEWSDVAREFFNKFISKHLKCPDRKCSENSAYDNKYVGFDEGPIKSCRCYNPGDGTLTMCVEIRTDDGDFRSFLKRFREVSERG